MIVFSLKEYWLVSFISEINKNLFPAKKHEKSKKTTVRKISSIKREGVDWKKHEDKKHTHKFDSEIQNVNGFKKTVVPHNNLLTIALFIWVYSTILVGQQDEFEDKHTLVVVFQCVLGVLAEITPVTVGTSVNCCPLPV